MATRPSTSITLLLLALAPTAAAQVDTAWDVQYTYAPKPFVSPIDVLPQPGGGVVTVGLGFTNASLQGDADVVVASFNEYGEHRWTWSDLCVASNGSGHIGRPIAFGGVDAAGNVCVTYSRSVTSGVVSLDPVGAVRWQDSMLLPQGTTGCAATGIDVAPSGDVRIAGFGVENTTWPALRVESFDSSGVRLWTWTGGVNQGTPGMPHGVRIAPNGETYVFGQNDYAFTPYFKTFAMRLDTSGQLVWYDDLATNAGAIAFTHGDIAANGDLVVAYAGWVSNFPGSDPVARVSRFGPAGNLGSSASLVSYLSPSGGFMRDLKAAPSGDTFVAFAGSAQLVRVDAAGAILPEWTLPSPGAQILAIAPTLDGGAIVTAARSGGGAVGTVDARFDQAGSVVWLQERPGLLPLGLDLEFSNRTDVDIAFDHRGNAFIANMSTGASSRTGIAKLIEGGDAGTTYCGPAPLNSIGSSASIRAIGSNVRARDNVSLVTSGLPTGSLVLYIASRQQGFVVGPGGSQGDLCLGGTIGRYLGPGQARRARADGTSYIQLDLDLIPQPNSIQSAVVGETWNFQCWYRDSLNGTNTSNFSNGVSVQML